MKAILVLDDNHEFLDLVSRFLEGSHYDVVQVDNLDAALHHIDNGLELSGAIVDFWIGQRSALPLLDALQSRHPDLPIIMVSGGGGGISLETTQAVGEISGVLHFLQKPFRKAELIDLLDEMT